MAFTFFFRDQEPLEHAIRSLMITASGRSRVRIWDAGCAMGPEPYTLAMLLAENMNQFAFRNLQIYATDHDAPLLKTMAEAVYPLVELDRIPKDIFQKYFEPAEREGWFHVVEKIRSIFVIQHHDLLSLKPLRDDFSLVVCKNVLLHFQQAERIEVYKMFHRSLESMGLLVNEHTQKLPAEVGHLFKQVISDNQIHQKCEARP